jgi:hypothetical protein
MPELCDCTCCLVSLECPEWTLIKETISSLRGSIIRHYVSPNGERLHLEFSYTLIHIFCYYASDDQSDWEIWDIPWKLIKDLNKMIGIGNYVRKHENSNTHKQTHTRKEPEDRRA